jgi:hypothetical protein
VFEGNYDSITLHPCKNATLRNVRARSIVLQRSGRATLRNVRAQTLEIERSVVELTDVDVVGNELGARIQRSKVKWTGGRIEAPVCMDLDHSELNLMGVSCVFEQASLQVRTPSSLVTSVSELRRGESRYPIHGEYYLHSTLSARAPAMRSAPASRHSAATPLSSRRQSAPPPEHGRDPPDAQAGLAGRPEMADAEHVRAWSPPSAIVSSGGSQ